MRNDKESLQPASELRRRAEDTLRRRVVDPQKLSREDAVRLVHELQVHQIELEMQNEELRRAQRALDAAHDRYLDLYDFAPISYLTTDAHGRIREANLTGASLLGVERGRLMCSSLYEFIADPDQDLYYRTCQQVLAANEPASFEARAVGHDGRRFDAQIICRPFAAPDGKPLYRLVINDITTRKQAERALLQEKERAQVTLESIGDGVITTDAQGVVEYLNPVAEALTGWSEAAARGKPAATVFHTVTGEDRQPTQDSVRRCLELGRIVRGSDPCILINRSGREFAVQDSAAPMRDRSGRVLGVVLAFHDVTELRRMTQRFAHHAAHDALTGLKNRREFERRLEHAVASSRAQGSCHALCFLDLDQFKLVNDSAGHSAGDELLRQLTESLLGQVRERDTLARLGGDEFGLLLDNCPQAKALEIAENLVASVRGFRFVWKDRSFQIGVSIGLVPITAGTEDARRLLAQADVACYRAKDLGRSRVHLYEREDGENARLHPEFLRVAGLRDALEQERFCLYHQAIVPLEATHSPPAHYELLVRLVDSQGTIVLPQAFIPAAERFGLMGLIDRWVIRAGFCHYVDAFGRDGDACFAINLSGNSLNDDTMLDFVRGQFAELALRPDRICFEITETAAIHNLSRATQFIADLKKIGCRFALDDFGTGLSSFSYLKQLPVDYLKIDGHFVQGMLDNPVDQAMVKAINDIGHTMFIQTVAEYVETDAIAERLRTLGVDFMQGYAAGLPLPLEELTRPTSDAANAPAASN